MAASDYNTIVILVLYVYLVSVSSSTKDPMFYVSTEHVNITSINPEYFAFFNASAARPGRWDPKYYVHFHVGLVKTLDNNVTVDFYFYEFRSNEYRRGFVEMHFGFCDLVLKDIFFGPALRANLPSCPLLPGEYKLSNMSIPDLPLLRTFPFRKARIYVEVAATSGAPVGTGYIDMEIKTKPRQTKAQGKTDRRSVGRGRVGDAAPLQ